MLTTQSISKKFSDELSLSFPDIQLKDRDQCILVGDSGSGKTTLLHVLGGLITSDSGSINLNGQDLVNIKPSQMDIFRGQNIGLIFQKSYLINALNVYENIALAQRLANIRVNPEWINNILKELGLEEKTLAKVNTLSQGQAQRVAIARAMVNKPQLILADEPTASLDDTHAEAVIEIIKSQANKYQSNLIIATHDNRVKEMFDQRITLPKYEYAQA